VVLVAEENFDVRLARLEEKVDMILSKISEFVTCNLTLDSRLRDAETKLIIIETQHAQSEKDNKNNMDKIKFYIGVITFLLFVIELYFKFGMK
jgi:hypothetical protein